MRRFWRVRSVTALRPPHQEVFEDESPVAAAQRSTTDRAIDVAVARRFCFDPDDLINSVALRALERGCIEHGGTPEEKDVKSSLRLGRGTLI
jgi:hypothetical protein